jgi:hypothetical protein
MFGRPWYSRVMSANMDEVARRFWSVERRLERVAGHTAAGAMVDCQPRRGNRRVSVKQHGRPISRGCQFHGRRNYEDRQ